MMSIKTDSLYGIIAVNENSHRSFTQMTKGKNVEFGEWLREELENRNWSQAELGRRTNRVRQVYSPYIKGKVKSPNPEVLKDIADAFGLPRSLVFEKAGFLDTQDENPPGLAEWMHIFRIADDEERERLLDYARYIRDRR